MVPCPNCVFAIIDGKNTFMTNILNLTLKQIGAYFIKLFFFVTNKLTK
jgi:hypothetical protein